jgi:hypothetical protein
MDLDLQSIATALGGEISGGQVLVPGPGHSRRDRSLAVKPNEGGDDLVVRSFACDDPIICKDYVRQRCGMAPWEPGHGNGKSPERRSAELAPKLAKGCAVYAEGSLRLDNWQQSDGTPRSGLSCLAWHCRLSQIGRNKPKRDTTRRLAPARGDGDFYNDELPI